MKYAFAFALVVFIGCDAAVPVAVPDAVPTQVVQVTPDPVSPVAVTQEQITRLFSCAWNLNEKASREYKGNKSQMESDALAAILADNWDVHVWFKDAGIAWHGPQQRDVGIAPEIIPCPPTMIATGEYLRILGPDSFAFLHTDGCWLVFTKR